MRVSRPNRRICPSLMTLVAVVAAVAPVVPARAVIILTQTGSGNTTAPADDPGFANVGYAYTGHGTAIYLGEGWVLTCNHVGGTGIVLASGTYLKAEGPGTGFSLVNTTPGTNTYTDLYMFKLATQPVGLPTLSIASSMPDIGAPVTMIGGGLDRGAFEQWTVTTSTTGPWTWTPVESGGNAAGFGTLGTRAIRWGTNNISDKDFWVQEYYGSGTNDYYEIKSLATTFNGTGPATEAQAVLYDSGGAVFTKVGGQWQLAGVMYAAVGYPDQPSPLFNAVFGDETWIADLSYYRPQIVAATPEPSAAILAALGVSGLVASRLAARRRRRSRP
ncbi:MAG: hypothetical protein ACKOSQ_07080 [Planctomycetaceae bacterium]